MAYRVPAIDNSHPAKRRVGISREGGQLKEPSPPSDNPEDTSPLPFLSSEDQGSRMVPVTGERARGSSGCPPWKVGGDVTL